MRKKDSIAFGSKSANLGEMLNSTLSSATVPDGFTIPFYWYDKFIKDNKFDEIFEEFDDDNDFVHNPSSAAKGWKSFARRLQAGNFDETLTAD